MSASSVKLGIGTLLKRGSTSIPELDNVAIKPARDSVDVTNHDSTAPNREFIAGLLDGGTVTFDANFLPGSTNQRLITTDLFASGDTRTTWSIVWIDGPTTWSFSAFVMSFEPTGTVAGKLTASGSLKVAGPVSIS